FYTRVNFGVSGSVLAPPPGAAPGRPVPQPQQPQPGAPGQQQPQPGQQPQQPQQPQPQQPPPSIFLKALPRFNAILVAAPQIRLEDITKEIKKLDLPSTREGQTVAFPLKKDNAKRVETLLTQFYRFRYPNET